MKKLIKANKPTPRQRKFVEEYLIDLNATQAAIRAGYSRNRASEIGYQLVHKPTVARAIENAATERAKRAQIDADYVLLRLREVVERCMQPVPIMVRSSSGEMIESGVFKFDSAGAIRALEMLGKHLGLFSDRLDINGGVSVIVKKFNG